MDTETPILVFLLCTTFLSFFLSFSLTEPTLSNEHIEQFTAVSVDLQEMKLRIQTNTFMGGCYCICFKVIWAQSSP